MTAMIRFSLAVLITSIIGQTSTAAINTRAEVKHRTTIILIVDESILIAVVKKREQLESFKFLFTGLLITDCAADYFPWQDTFDSRTCTASAIRVVFCPCHCGETEFEIITYV